MTIRKLVVPIDGSEGSAATLAAAFALARQFIAHLDVLHVRADPGEAVALAGESMSGEILEELIEITEKQSEARAAMARAAFDQALASSGLPRRAVPEPGSAGARYIEEQGREDDLIVRHGRLADLIVVASQRDRRDLAVSSAFDAALLGTGRPVFVAGPGPLGDGFRHVMVAWNGSIEAARAVGAALPFLLRAEAVTLSATESEAGETPATSGLAEFLLCHGIHATARLLDPAKPAAEALSDLAATADLLVMGAYTHSRLWQLIVGGVTRHMLKTSPVPLLMSH